MKQNKDWAMRIKRDGSPNKKQYKRKKIKLEEVSMWSQNKHSRGGMTLCH